MLRTAPPRWVVQPLPQRIFSTAIGTFATADGTSATAVGEDSAECFGGFLNGAWYCSQGFGQLSTALGTYAMASNESATALGDSANAFGPLLNLALGSDANASFSNSTAVGAFAATTRADQIVLGNASAKPPLPISPVLALG